MSLAFPSTPAPTVNQIAVAAGVSYTFNGSAWVKDTGTGTLKTVGGQSLAGTGNIPIPEIYVGTFATAAALSTAFPAASNIGKSALVGTIAPYVAYTCNGTDWIPPTVTSTVDGKLLDSSNRDMLGKSIAAITYSAGRVQSVTGANWTASVTYNANGSVNTYTENGTVRTVTYNGDGTVASFQ
jgi:hypothetical protein